MVTLCLLQAYLAQLQQHQQLQYMQRFGAGFPMTGPPNSMNAVAQQAYEQMAALHASFGEFEKVVFFLNP